MPLIGRRLILEKAAADVEEREKSVEVVKEMKMKNKDFSFKRRKS